MIRVSIIRRAKTSKKQLNKHINRKVQVKSKKVVTLVAGYSNSNMLLLGKTNNNKLEFWIRIRQILNSKNSSKIVMEN